MKKIKKLFMEALDKPQGMLLITGPTGSGKTVSLYTGLNILNTEDPIFLLPKTLSKLT
jgi:type IV pilus assembly protein PilB